MGKADTEEVGVYLGGAKYFMALSIAHCDWVVYAVNAGDKPMGLLVVPAWWSLAKKKKKQFCRPLQCLGPPGKCPVCPITSPALSLAKQKTEVLKYAFKILMHIYVLIVHKSSVHVVLKTRRKKNTIFRWNVDFHCCCCIFVYSLNILLWSEKLKIII